MSVEDKIRKLLRLSESNPNEEEANLALAQAQRIAARYHLDLASLPPEDVDPLEHRMGNVGLWSRRQKAYRWELAHVVAAAHGCAPWSGKNAVVDLERCPDDATIKAAFHADRSFTYDSAPIAGGLTRITARWLWIRGPSVASIEHRLSDFGVKRADVHGVLVMFGRREAAQSAIYVYHVLLHAVDDMARKVAHGRAALNSARWGIVTGLGVRLGLDEDEQPQPEFATDETSMVLAKATEDSRRFLADSFGSDPYKGKAKLVIRDRAAFARGVDAAEELDVPDPNNARVGLGGALALPPGSDRQLSVGEG